MLAFLKGKKLKKKDGSEISLYDNLTTVKTRGGSMLLFKEDVEIPELDNMVITEEKYNQLLQEIESLPSDEKKYKLEKH